MKKLIALILAVLLIFSLTACGGKDPNLGKYNVVSSSMIGTENDWVELKKGGKGTFFSGFEFDMKWELEGENFTGTVTFLGMEESLIGTLKDGILTVSYGDISYVFAKEGAEVTESAGASDAEGGKSNNNNAEAPAAEDDSFFAAGTEWNGWIMKGDEMLDAVAKLDIDPDTNKMYFDVYFDTDADNAFYSAFVENLEDRTLRPVIGNEDAWVDDVYMAEGDEYTYAFYRNYDDGIVSTSTLNGTDLMLYFKKADAEWNPDAEMLPPDQSDIKIAGQAADEPEEPTDEPADTPADTSAVAGEMFNAGNFSALVPEGWMAFPVEDLFADEDGAIDPNALKICKGGETEWDLFSKPMVEIKYYGANSDLWPPEKDWYDDAKDVASFTAGNFTWQGFSGSSFDMPLTILWGENGEDEYQINIWTQQDENGEKIAHTDADVQAILASLTLG